MKLSIREDTSKFFKPDISKYNCKNPKKLNVYIICDYMNWNLPTFADMGANGYICKWGGRTQVDRYGIDKVQEDLDKVYEGTGIRCTITRSGKIVIPFYERKKSIKESHVTPSLFFVFDSEYECDDMVEQEALGWLNYKEETDNSNITDDMIIEGFVDQGYNLVSEEDVNWYSHSNGYIFAISAEDLCFDVQSKIEHYLN